MQPRHADVLERDLTTPSNSRTAATRTPAKPRDKSKEKLEKPVDLSFQKPNARSVCIAGTFNNWDHKQTPMQKAADGSSWTVTLPLRPGRYEYRFVVDGEWISDPNAKETTRNDFGSTNSVLVV
jgi:1,4-alpha-glucan branching enzyme